MGNGKLTKKMEAFIKQKIRKNNAGDAGAIKKLIDVTLDEILDQLENMERKDDAWLRQEIRKSNDSCLNAMIKYGVKEVKMTPAEVEEIKKKVTPLWDQLAKEGLYPTEVLKNIKQDLATFRAQHKP